jgi:hypothetical protein
MKNVLLIILTTIAISADASAQAVSFDYDASGNQVERRADIFVQDSSVLIASKSLKAEKASLVVDTLIPHLRT